MFNGVKKWNARRWRIAELRKYITGTYESELRGAKSEQERGEAYQIAHSIVQVEENELEYLQQETLQRRLGHSPIEVPNEYWNDKDLWEKPTLTNKGERGGSSERYGWPMLSFGLSWLRRLCCRLSQSFFLSLRL